MTDREAEPTTPDARRVGARVEQLLDGLAAIDDPRSREHAEELVRLLHGLHPQDMEQRVSSVLRGLGSRADVARLMGVDPDGVARVQLRRTGCSSTAAAARQLIERAITVAVRR